MTLPIEEAVFDTSKAKTIGAVIVAFGIGWFGWHTLNHELAYWEKPNVVALIALLFGAAMAVLGIYNLTANPHRLIISPAGIKWRTYWVPWDQVKGLSDVSLGVGKLICIDVKNRQACGVTRPRSKNLAGADITISTKGMTGGHADILTAMRKYLLAYQKSKRL